MKTRGILTYLILFCTTVSCTKYKVTITSTSPVALDTPIWFNAEIFPGENKNYSFHWKDDTGFSQKIVTEGPRSNWSIIYPTPKYEILTGPKTVTVKVYNADSYNYFMALATGSLTYTLNDRISGNIVFSQPNVTGIKAGCISTLNATNITTSLHDPFNWIRDRIEKVTYYYNINNKDNTNHMVVGPCLTPSVIVNITDPGRYIIEVTVILIISSNTTTAPTTTTTTALTTTNKTTTTTRTSQIPTIPPSSTSLANKSSTHNLTNFVIVEDPQLRGYECGGHGLSSSEDTTLMDGRTRYTFAFISVDAAEPLSKMNVTGATWIKHGDMLHLYINCTGTGPYRYCFNITHGSFNKTDPKICTHPRVYTNVCDYEIHYYLPNNGTYSLVLSMDNDVSSQIERHGINVYNTDKEKQLTYIIVPMTCTIIAILMIIFGIARYIQNKKRYCIEVADFDFGVSDEHVYKPFIQQLRDAVTSSCTANFEDPPKRRYIERPRILEDDDDEN